MHITDPIPPYELPTNFYSTVYCDKPPIQAPPTYTCRYLIHTSFQSIFLLLQKILLPEIPALILGHGAYGVLLRACCVNHFRTISLSFTLSTRPHQQDCKIPHQKILMSTLNKGTHKLLIITCSSCPENCSRKHCHYDSSTCNLQAK